MTPESEIALIPGRVAAGIEYIKAHGRLDKIDPESFDINSPCDCALSQAFENNDADFWGLLIKRGLRYTQAIDLGFSYKAGEEHDRYWDALQAEWIKQLKEKQV